MHTIRILEKESNKKGDLFVRLMKDLFLTLGYDKPRLNIHKAGREIDIEAEHRIETKLAIAECKALGDKVGGGAVNKFRGALGVEKNRNRKTGKEVEGYFISLSGFTETAVEQEKEAGAERVNLLDGNRVVEELIRGNILASPLQVMERAARCAAKQADDLRAEEPFELLAHDMGWIWRVYFTKNRQRTHFALIHADGGPLAGELARIIIEADRSVGGVLHTMTYLPPESPSTNAESRVEEAREKYLTYLEAECGQITLEGLPADQEVGSRRLNLENIFVPLHLEQIDDHRRARPGF